MPVIYSENYLYSRILIEKVELQDSDIVMSDKFDTIVFQHPHNNEELLQGFGIDDIERRFWTSRRVFPYGQIVEMYKDKKNFNWQTILHKEINEARKICRDSVLDKINYYLYLKDERDISAIFKYGLYKMVFGDILLLNNQMHYRCLISNRDRANSPYYKPDDICFEFALPDFTGDTEPNKSFWSRKGTDYLRTRIMQLKERMLMEVNHEIYERFEEISMTRDLHVSERESVIGPLENTMNEIYKLIGNTNIKQDNISRLHNLQTQGKLDDEMLRTKMREISTKIINDAFYNPSNLIPDGYVINADGQLVSKDDKHKRKIIRINIDKKDT